MSLLVFRKLLNNRWMFVCLFIGFLIIATVVSSIPMYTNAILQRVLILDLQDYQAEYHQYPGTYQVSQTFNFSTQPFPVYDDYISNTLMKQIKVPTVGDVTRLEMGLRSFVRTPYSAQSAVARINITALKNFKDKVEILFGREAKPGLVDGAYEVTVNEYTMKNMSLDIGGEYLFTMPYSAEELFSSVEAGAYFKFRVVGVVKPVDINDPYWFMDMNTYDQDIFMDYDTMVSDFSDNGYISEANWYKAYDYTKIKISDVRDIIKTLDTQTQQYIDMGGTLRFNMPTIEHMKQYLPREASLQITLWVLILPIMVLLCFYIFMVSRMKLESEANEISVLKSRGASRMQIFNGYIMEWGILAGLSMIFGPLLGYLSCYILGSSNGFLDFVVRKALPVSIDWKAFLYALAAMVLFAIAMLIPAFSASKLSIVEHKQISARSSKKPLWQKLGLDFILCAVSIYGLVRYKDILSNLTTKGTTVASMGVDPLMFVITSAFMLGIGLLFLRFYPYIVQFLFYLGKKKWTPPFYSSFIRIGRSGSKEIFVMLFIIYSIAVGIFSANSARTINNNLVDRYEYLNGADVVADIDMKALKPPLNLDALVNDNDCVEAAAEVINIPQDSNDFVLKLGNQKQNPFNLMGIEPYSFGTATTLRSDLLPYHINEYLNIINGAQTAVLLSSDYAANIAVGDSVTLEGPNGASISCIVYGFVDYWPGYKKTVYNEGVAENKSLVVVNSSLLKLHFSDSYQNYVQIWMARKDGSTIEDFTKAMGKSIPYQADIETQAAIGMGRLTLDYGSLAVKDLNFSSQKVVKVKNDPTIQGFNGMLSLVFLITMGITTVGFLIYWILSLRSRTLQFGIYRAIGMSQNSVMAMIGVEQILVSLMSILFGLLLGDVTSLLFIRLFEMVYTAEERVIPFQVFHQMSDYLKVYLVIGIMIAIGVGVLVRVISSIKIDQALKLGED